MPAGRPTKYKKAYCDKLIGHMKRGLSYEAFAAVAEVSIQTLYDWEKKHPEFLEAKRQGFAQSRKVWEEFALTGLFAGEKDPKLNSSVWIFNMKNRFGWKDNPDSEKPTELKIKIDSDDEEL